MLSWSIYPPTSGDSSRLPCRECGRYGSRTAEAIDTARTERTNPTESYLLGIPLLADYLEEGLEKLGYSIEAVEQDVL